MCPPPQWTRCGPGSPWTSPGPLPAGSRSAPTGPARPGSGGSGARGWCGTAWSARPRGRPGASADAAADSFDADLRDAAPEVPGLLAVRGQLGQVQSGRLTLERFLGLQPHLPVTGELTGGDDIAGRSVIGHRTQLEGAAGVAGGGDHHGRQPRLLGQVDPHAHALLEAAVVGCGVVLR